MEKIIIDAVYNKKDNEYYALDKNKKALKKDSKDEEIIFGNKIFFLENKITIAQEQSIIKKIETRKARITISDNIELGDIVCVNNKKFICLYFDRTRTILSERVNGEVGMDNIFQVPSQALYLKAGKAFPYELVNIKAFIERYRGLFRELYVKAIEKDLDLVLTK